VWASSAKVVAIFESSDCSFPGIKDFYSMEFERTDCEVLLEETLLGGEVYISKSFIKKRIHPFLFLEK
jgi:hypothetical protein